MANNEVKYLRRLSMRLTRNEVESLIKHHDPKRKPWLANLPYLRDSLALIAYHDPAIREALIGLASRPR
jgi:hypothetical protein